MKTLKFSGASDDLFEIEGTGRGEPDEIGADQHDMAAVKVANDHGGLIVLAVYAPSVVGVGCWSIGISPIDEDVAIPAWPVRISAAGNGYSTMLELDVPDDVRVSLIDTAQT